MRRPVVVGVVVIVAVLALPAARRGIAAGLGSLGRSARERAAAFRQDYATREAELRAALLPDPATVAAAERHRAAREDVEPY